MVVADMRAIPFADASFDGVWASASLLHLPRSELAVALREINRILRSDGLLFASVKTGTHDIVWPPQWESTHCNAMQTARIDTV